MLLRSDTYCGNHTISHEIFLEFVFLRTCVYFVSLAACPTKTQFLANSTPNFVLDTHFLFGRESSLLKTCD